ncbi:MAG: hypothetical protein ACK4IY_08875 [Chitinophagales bacterium]
MFSCAQKCENNSTPFIPLADLTTSHFMEYTGGKYPDGKNAIPYLHFKSGMFYAQNIKPLQPDGSENAQQGKIGFLILGFSTAAMTGNFFKLLCRQQQINNRIRICIGAQGGMDMNTMINNNTNYWSKVLDVLSDDSLSKKQIQIIWLSTGDIQAYSLPFPEQSFVQVEKFQKILQTIKVEFPNCKLVFISDRTYAGYIDANALAALAEPTAYYNSWAVKFLIENQIKNISGFTYDALPFIDWGPMLWTNGVTGNNAGYSWDCADAGKGGIHPTARGRAKEAALLFLFFKQHPYTAGLFTSE